MEVSADHQSPRIKEIKADLSAGRFIDAPLINMNLSKGGHLKMKRDD